MATIKEIAEKAGVSRGTVDRVLHNRGRVDKEVSERVLEIAKSLDYHPNKAGQALAASARVKKINVVMPSLANPFFLDIKAGMEKASEGNGFSISFFHYSGYGEKESIEALGRALDEGCDALLVTLPDLESIREKLESSLVPFASVNSALSTDKCLFYSGPDYNGKGRINAGLLSIASPSSQPRILFLRGSDAMKGHKEILSGFLNALNERGIKYTLSREIDTKDQDLEAERLTGEALESDKEINTVFISTSGIGGALKAIGERKLLVFTSDDTEEVCSALKSGRVKWTVSQEPFLQGYNAVEKMADYLITHTIPTPFIARNIVKIKENIGEEICL